MTGNGEGARQDALAAFLERAGWSSAVRHSLPGDASFRRYLRLCREQGESCLLMDASPPREDVRPFAKLARHLVDCGFSAPRILDADEDMGFLLIEDFGEDTFTRLLARDPGCESALYELAVDCLAALHHHPRTASLDVPPYDEAALLREAALLADWYFPAMTGAPPAPSVRAEYLQAWREVFADLPATAEGLVLRDFHVDNLMLLPGREGAAACGLLDFQDALKGPLAYDLVSLLEDARRDLEANFVERLRARYRANAPEGVEWGAFDLWYSALGAQRHAKVAGIFVRLLWRDGKDVYLRHIPRVVRLLRRKLESERHLAPVAAWFQGHLPDYAEALPPPEVWSGRPLPTST